MAATLGHLIVDNKPGANGNIAAQFVADASADDSAILGRHPVDDRDQSERLQERAGSPPDSFRSSRASNRRLMLFNPFQRTGEDAGRIDRVGEDQPQDCHTRHTAPARPRIFGFQMNERFGLDMAHVPHRGAAATDLLAGHALIGFTQVQGALEHVRGGRFDATSPPRQRARAVPAHGRRSPSSVSRARRPRSVQSAVKIRHGGGRGRPHRGRGRAHADAGVRARLEEQGFEVASSATGPAFKAGIDAKFERWARIVKATGFSAGLG